MDSGINSPMPSENQIWQHISTGVCVLVQKMAPGGIAFCVVVKQRGTAQWVVTKYRLRIPGRKLFNFGNRGFLYRSTKKGPPLSVHGKMSAYGIYNPRRKMLGAK